MLKISFDKNSAKSAIFVISAIYHIYVLFLLVTLHDMDDFQFSRFINSNEKKFKINSSIETKNIVLRLDSAFVSLLRFIDSKILLSVKLIKKIFEQKHRTKTPISILQ